MWEVATITDAGSNLLASWITGTELRITRAAAGSGTVADADLYALTALKEQKQSMSIVGMSQDENGVTVKLQLEAATDAYTLQQIGVFAKVGSGTEALLAVFQDNVGISIPAASTSQSFIYNFFATIAVNNTGTLTIEIDGGASVTLRLCRTLSAINRIRSRRPACSTARMTGRSAKLFRVSTSMPEAAADFTETV